MPYFAADLSDSLSPAFFLSATIQMSVLLEALVNLKGLLMALLNGLLKKVVWILFKFCFCRDWRRILIVETSIPKLKTEYFRDRRWGWLCKTGGCFYFPFSDCSLFCLSNFLCIVRTTCHGAWLIFQQNRLVIGRLI